MQSTVHTSQEHRQRQSQIFWLRRHCWVEGSPAWYPGAPRPASGCMWGRAWVACSSCAPDAVETSLPVHYRAFLSGYPHSTPASCRSSPSPHQSIRRICDSMKSTIQVIFKTCASHTDRHVSYVYFLKSPHAIVSSEVMVKAQHRQGFTAAMYKYPPITRTLQQWIFRCERLFPVMWNMNRLLNRQYKSCEQGITSLVTKEVNLQSDHVRVMERTQQRDLLLGIGRSVTII